MEAGRPPRRMRTRDKSAIRRVKEVLYCTILYLHNIQCLSGRLDVEGHYAGDPGNCG